MTITNTLAAATLLGALMLGQAQAQEAMTPEQTYKDIETTLGMVPGFMKAYPKSGIAGMWQVSKNMELSDKTALDPKTKALIGVAVAAQIPCRYCVWLDTKTARANGASDEEIAEAVAQAGMTRNWSTVLHGMQIDFDTFKSEFGGGS